jgi:hypothetical protein
MLAEQHCHAGRHLPHPGADGRGDHFRDGVARQRHEAFDQPAGRGRARDDIPGTTLLMARDDDAAGPESARSAHHEAVAVRQSGGHAVTHHIDYHQSLARQGNADGGYRKRGKPTQDGEQEL